MLFFIPWPILIYFVRKEEREYSTAALGNSRPFCPPSRHPLFLPSPVFYLFIHPLFSRSRLQTERVRSPFRDSKPWNRIWLLLHLSILASAPLSSPLPFAPWYYSDVFFYPTTLHLSCLQKAPKGCRESFSSRWRIGLWEEKPSEELPKAKETLSNN